MAQSAYQPLIEHLLTDGRYTRAEIADIVFEKFPKVKKNTILQLLSDAKTIPLLKSRVVEIERRKCLAFGEPWEDSVGEEVDEEEDSQGHD